MNKDLKKMISTLESYKLYHQERVVRWQTREYMFSSNDAQHQLYTTQIALIVGAMLKLDDNTVLMAIRYAACHDYVECSAQSLGDINYGLKEKDPTLKQLVKDYEHRAMQLVPEFYNAMTDCNKDEKAMTLVKLADALEALLYVQREIKFNKCVDEWLEVQKELLDRVTILYDKLNK